MAVFTKLFARADASLPPGTVTTEGNFTLYSCSNYLDCSRKERLITVQIPDLKSITKNITDACVSREHTDCICRPVEPIGVWTGI